MVCPLVAAFGVGPKRTIIRLDNDTLHNTHGWMFKIDVQVKDVTSTRRIPGRPLDWGIHLMGDGWMVNGSRDGTVELKFSRPVTSKSVQMWSST